MGEEEEEGEEGSGVEFGIDTDIGWYGCPNGGNGNKGGKKKGREEEEEE